MWQFKTFQFEHFLHSRQQLHIKYADLKVLKILSNSAGTLKFNKHFRFFLERKMRFDEISKSREQNSQKKLRHFLTNSAAQHVYSLQSTRVVFQSIQWHVNSLTRYANELANDERDEACSSGAFWNLKLSDFLKKGRRRHNDEKTDRTDWFLQPFSTWNQSINTICVHQSGENTDRSVRSRNQTSFCLMLFDWREILSSRTLLSSSVRVNEFHHWRPRDDREKVIFQRETAAWRGRKWFWRHIMDH